MGVSVTPPFSEAVVVIADELVERYESQGWSVAEQPKEKPETSKRRSGK